MKEIASRIEKDIRMFENSIEKLKNLELNDKEKRILELAVSYSNDARSWISKKDFYTAFASISYAHGLLDALIKIKT